MLTIQDREQIRRQFDLALAAGMRAMSADLLRSAQALERQYADPGPGVTLLPGAQAGAAGEAGQQPDRTAETLELLREYALRQKAEEDRMP